MDAPECARVKILIDADRRVGRQRLRRGSIERRLPVQMIDFDENRACLRGPATAKDSAHAFHSASTQISGDPDVGAQAHRVLAPGAARRLGQLFDEPLIDFSRGRQAVGVLKLLQRLLGGGSLFSVRFDCVAQFSQGRLGGKNQPRRRCGSPRPIDRRSDRTLRRKRAAATDGLSGGSAAGDGAGGTSASALTCGGEEGGVGAGAGAGVGFGSADPNRGAG